MVGVGSLVKSILSTVYVHSDEFVSGQHFLHFLCMQADLTNGTGIPGTGVEPTTAVSMDFYLAA